MISIRYTASLLTLALGAATIGFAGEQDKTSPYQPVVTHVGSGMAVEPGRILIEGRGLGLIQEVRLDGAVLPVERNTGYQLWIAPPPRDPGFGKLELAYPRVTVDDSPITAALAPHLRVIEAYLRERYEVRDVPDPLWPMMVLERKR